MMVLKVDPQPLDLNAFVTKYSLRRFDGRPENALGKTWPNDLEAVSLSMDLNKYERIE